MADPRDSFTPCGTDCNECEKYPDECAGCFEIEGKVFWSQYVNEEKCPLYACCVDERHLPHCGRCGDFPCRHCNLDDPRLSREENAAIHDEKYKRLLADR